MSFAAIGLTAFICFGGLYKHLRVPCGLKGAPSYFHRVMAHVVLAGLVSVICEVYIDDIIVHEHRFRCMSSVNTASQSHKIIRYNDNHSHHYNLLYVPGGILRNEGLRSQ